MTVRMHAFLTCLSLSLLLWVGLVCLGCAI